MSCAAAPTPGAFSCPRCPHPPREALLGPPPRTAASPQAGSMTHWRQSQPVPCPGARLGRGLARPRDPPEPPRSVPGSILRPPLGVGWQHWVSPGGGGGADPGLPGRWAMAELLLRLACRAASEISHRRCCGNGGKKPIFSQPFASLAGNALGARGGHAQPTAPVGVGWGDTIPDPQIPLRGLESCGTPKGTGLCQGVPKTDPRRAGCPPAAKNPKNSRS